MRTLAENSNNDLFVIPGTSSLGVLVGLDAVLQSCKSAIETQRGELQYDTARGVPTNDTIWTGVPNQQRFQAYCIEAIRAVPGVRKITRFDTEVRGNEVLYETTIVTNFGTGTVGNSISGL